MDRLTRQHIKDIEQEEKTPRTEAAFRAYIHDASLEGIRREMRKLETELTVEREQRKLAGRVAQDALDARNRAEEDRDKARAALREELLKHDDADWTGSGRTIR